MGKFMEFLKEKYNYDIDGKDNPYIGLDKRKLTKKKDSFNIQVADLQNKLLRGNMGASGDKKQMNKEITELKIKLEQVEYILKGL